MKLLKFEGFVNSPILIAPECGISVGDLLSFKDATVHYKVCDIRILAVSAFVELHFEPFTFKAAIEHGWTDVPCSIVRFDGWDHLFALHQSLVDDDWVLSDYRSGHYIKFGHSPAEAVANALDALLSAGVEKVSARILAIPPVNPPLEAEVFPFYIASQTTRQ